MLSDEEIVDLIARASPDGIEMLYDRYGPRAYSLALHILKDGAAAEDVVQEAFLSVWRRVATYRPDRGSLRSWLLSIVHHRAVDRLRGRAARQRQDLPLEAARTHAVPSDTADIVLATIEREDVRRAVDLLSDEQRRVLELAYFSGHTQSEISGLLDLPLGTVKSRTRAALQRLSLGLSELRPEGGR